MGFLFVLLGLAILIHPSHLRLLKSEMENRDILNDLWGYVQGDSSRLTLLLLAQSLEKEGNYEQSLEVWHRIVHRFPKYAPYYDSLGLRYAWMGSRDSSLQLLLTKEKYMALRPSEQEEILALAHYLGQYELYGQRLWQAFQSGQKIPVGELEKACFEANLIPCRLKLSREQWQKQTQNTAYYEEYGRLLALYERRSLNTHLHWNLPPAQSPALQQRILWALEWGMPQIALEFALAPSPNDQIEWAKWLETTPLRNSATNLWERMVPVHAPDSLQQLLLNYYERNALPQFDQRLQVLLQGSNPKWVQLAWNRSIALKQWGRALELENRLWQQCQGPCSDSVLNALVFVKSKQDPQGLGTWLELHRSQIGRHRLLRTLAQTLSLDGQWKWLLQHVKQYPQDQELLESWLRERREWRYSDELLQVLGKNLQNSPIAKAYAQMALDLGQMSSAQKWLLLVPSQDTLQTQALKLERDQSWQKQNYPKAWAKQKALIERGAKADTSTVQLARDLWWQGYKQEARQAWKAAQKQGIKDSIGMEWQAIEPGPGQEQIRQEILSYIQKDDLNTMNHLQQWNSWDLAQKINVDRLSLAAWWIWIEMALRQNQWNLVEYQLQKFPKRRAQIPPYLQSLFIAKAESEYQLNHIGEANFWYQMARGGGW